MTWKITKKCFLSHLNKNQLRLSREIYISVLNEGTVFSHMEFASMVEGDKSSFLFHGARNHSCSDLTNCETIEI